MAATGLARGTYRTLATALVYLVLLAGWYLATRNLVAASRLRFPSPVDVVAAAEQITFRGYAGETLVEHIAETVMRVAMGFLFAASMGVAVGLAMGLQKRFELAVNPVVQIFRPVPPLAWIPLAILWFGLDSASKIFVAWLAVFTPALINTYTGVRNVDPVLVQAALVHGARWKHVVWRVVIPSALPMIFTGLRLSLQVSWMAVVASELVGSYSGLGHVMIIATRDLASPMIVVSMACVAVLGLFSTLLLSVIERWVIRWR